MQIEADAAKPQPQEQSRRFLLLYALACAGGAVSYVPLLTLLLPLHVRGLEGAAPIDALAYIAFSGAIAASIANIGFGWLSDITRNRRGWIIAGLALSSLLLISVRHTNRLGEVLVLIVVWQCTLNMMLAPLSAWAGDCVPDSQKGTLGGLLAFSRNGRSGRGHYHPSRPCRCGHAPRARCSDGCNHDFARAAILQSSSHAASYGG